MPPTEATAYGYNAAGDRQSVTYDSDGTPSITYTPDRNGRAVSVSDATGTHAVDYAPDDRCSMNTRILAAEQQELACYFS